MQLVRCVGLDRTGQGRARGLLPGRPALLRPQPGLDAAAQKRIVAAVTGQPRVHGLRDRGDDQQRPLTVQAEGPLADQADQSTVRRDGGRFRAQGHRPDRRRPAGPGQGHVRRRRRPDLGQRAAQGAGRGGLACPGDCGAAWRRSTTRTSSPRLPGPASTCSVPTSAMARRQPAGHRGRCCSPWPMVRPDGGTCCPRARSVRDRGHAGAGFRTVGPVTLERGPPALTVGVRAVARGPAGNLRRRASTAARPRLGDAAPQPGRGHGHPDQPGCRSPAASWPRPDADYRARLLGVPRTSGPPMPCSPRSWTWTGYATRRSSTRSAGWTSRRATSPCSCSASAPFALPRQIGSPYYFDIVVATEPGWPWTHRRRHRSRHLRHASSIPSSSGGPRRSSPTSSRPTRWTSGIRATLVVQAGPRPGRHHAADLLDALHASCGQAAAGPRRAVLRRDAARPHRTRRARRAEPAPAPLPAGVRRHRVRRRDFRPVGGTGDRGEPRPAARRDGPALDRLRTHRHRRDART